MIAIEVNRPRMDQPALTDAPHKTGGTAPQEKPEEWFRINAYVNDSLAGTGRIRFDSVRSASIIDLSVQPEYRNRGIGGTLLKLMLAECKARRIKDIQLLHCEEDAHF
jgi:ribosomal protein S18 acetylase RimI-like enzyme